MASVLVYIETDNERPAAVSLETLGEGRRIASALGAAVYAAVVVPGLKEGRGLELEHDELVRELGRHGADKAVLIPGAAHQGPALWNSHGSALYAACEHLAPLLVLLASNAAGRDIAPRLAARMGAAYVPEPAIEFGPRGEVVYSRAAYGHTVRRRLSSESLDHSMVVTLTCGSYRTESGEDEAEVLILDAPVPSSSDRLEYLRSTDDPSARLAQARVIVIAGAGVRSAESYALVEQLADALGGEVAATRSLCELGIAPAEREVGVGAQRVAPSLYVVCGASGSAAHLGAVSSDAEIVAIDADPDAPIFRVASYGLVGELDAVLPALIEALREAPMAATS